MGLPSWLERPTEEPVGSLKPVTVPFAETKKFFAVDASASTMVKIMAAEKDCVLGLHANKNDFVCKWDTYCRNLQAVDSVPDVYFFGSGSGTTPSCILRDPVVVDQIKDSDMWVLLTDGEIWDREVAELTRLAEGAALTQVPVILLIVGGRYSTPENENISVGISFFAGARDALILYKDINDGAFFVVDGKGAFQHLKSRANEDLSDWNKLIRHASEDALKKELTSQDISFDPNRSQRQQKGFSLGPEWDSVTGKALVKVTNLLNESQIALEDLRNLLGEEAVTQLALICKTRGQLNDLRNFLLRHKQKEIVVRLEDRCGASRILKKIQAVADAQEKDRLTKDLRQAHLSNRRTYQELKDSPSEDAKRITEFNRLIDRGLRVISGFDKSSYTANILSRKSNRAMRSEAVTASDTELKLATLNLSSGVKAFRGSCALCCSDEEIMSICLKKLDSVEENTTDFALNFPLAAAQAKQNVDVISSQSICFQCSILLERSIYQENIVATLPTVDYNGPNRLYVNHQLYLALTAGLATGASGVVQLFATILDRTLETKSWCAKDLIEDSEIIARRKIFEWYLYNLLDNCSCRDNFTETGKWVKYPEALEWAANDFKEAGLDSWIIQYPIAGFCQLMRWFEILDPGLDKIYLTTIWQAKLLHFVTSKMMDGLLKSQDGRRSWTFPYLRIIYNTFNATGVPRDLGQHSLVTSGMFWEMLEKALEASQWSDVRRFLGMYRSKRSEFSIERFQIIIFWALYTQQVHTKPKTFFVNLEVREPLAPVVLDVMAEIPKNVVKEVLLSIFCPINPTDTAFVLHNTGAIVPFVSPYGPSVLQCGKPGCSTKFYDYEDLGKEGMHLTIREGRAKHLSEVFKVSHTFTSQTGLPESTIAPKAPSSSHITLHISTARTWARLDHPGRTKIMEALEQGDSGALKSFVAEVRQELCAQSHRGNIYSSTIEAEVLAVLPSFIAALRIASRRAGLEDQSGVVFEHDWTQNTIIWKMEYELALGTDEV